MAFFGDEAGSAFPLVCNDSFAGFEAGATFAFWRAKRGDKAVRVLGWLWGFVSGRAIGASMAWFGTSPACGHGVDRSGAFTNPVSAAAAGTSWRPGDFFFFLTIDQYRLLSAGLLGWLRRWVVVDGHGCRIGPLAGSARIGAVVLRGPLSAVVFGLFGKELVGEPAY